MKLVDADLIADYLRDEIAGNEDDKSVAGMLAKRVLKHLIGLVEDLPAAQPDTGLYTDGFNDGYKQAQMDAQPERKTGRWIPCSERLPEEYGEYFVTMMANGKPETRFINIIEGEENLVWDRKNKRFGFDWLLEDGYEDYTVLAWMPLPEPYTEEPHD